MTSRKLPIHDPRRDIDEATPIFRALRISKRADRFVWSGIEPPVDEEEDNSWLDEPIHLSIVRNWVPNKPATTDPQRYIFKQAHALIRNLTNHGERNDKFCIGVVPGLWKTGPLVHEDEDAYIYAPKAPRRAATGDHAMLLMHEFDGIGSRWVHEVHRALDDLDIGHVIHSTFSDAAKSELGFDTRCRLWTFPDRPLRTHEYTPVWKWWDLWFGGIADPAPKSIASVGYPPSHPVSPRAKELAWAIATLGRRFDADAIVEEMNAWIPRGKKTEHKLSGDLTNAGWLAEDLLVETDDGDMRPLGTLQHNNRFHAPDRADENASCTVSVDAEGVRRATDWSTGRHWRIGESDVVELRAWIAASRASCALIAPSSDALVAPLINTKTKDLNSSGSCGSDALVAPSINTTFFRPPDLQPRSVLFNLGVDEVIDVIDGSEMAIVLREQAQRATADGIGLTIFLQGDPGVGKTQAARELAMEHAEVLVINPSCKLAEANAERFGISYYEDVRPKEAPSSVSTTVHSRPKMPRKAQLTIIDELSECLRQTHAETNHDRNVRVYEDLVADLASTLCVVTGADVSREQIGLLVPQIRGRQHQQRIVVVRCTTRALHHVLKHGTQREVETHLFDTLATLAEDAPAIFCGGDTVEELETLAHEARSRFPGRLVGVLHGESDRGPATNIDAWIEAHRGGIVFVSHAAAVGISINVPVSYVFGIRTYRQVAAETFVQLLCRPRIVLNETIFVGQCAWHEGTHATDPAVIETRLLNGAATDRALRSHFLPGYDEPRVSCPSYLAARVQHERERAMSLNHPHVEIAAARYGWPSERATATVGVQLIDLKVSRKAVKEERDERINTAPDLDDVEEREAKKRSGQTVQERAALERKAIKDFYGTVSREIIRKDQRGRYRDRLRLFAHARLLQTDRGRLVVAADLRARGIEAHDALEKHVIVRAGLVGKLWQRLSGGRRIGEKGFVRGETLLDRGRDFVNELRKGIADAGLKPPSEKGLSKWLLARLKDAGAAVTSRQRGRGRASRDYDVVWPAEHEIVCYVAKLENVLGAIELRQIARAMRDDAARSEMAA